MDRMELPTPRGNIFLRFVQILLGFFCVLPQTSSSVHCTEKSSISKTSKSNDKKSSVNGSSINRTKTSSVSGSSPHQTKSFVSGSSLNHAKKSSIGGTSLHYDKSSSSSKTSKSNDKKSSVNGSSIHQIKMSSVSGSSPHQTKSFVSGSSLNNAKKSSIGGTSLHYEKSSSSSKTSNSNDKKSSVNGSSIHQVKKSSISGSSPHQTKSSVSGSLLNHTKKSSVGGTSLHYNKSSPGSRASQHVSNVLSDKEAGREEDQKGFISKFTTAASLCIERFSFIKELGRGGFGKVMLVEDTVSRELLAMKFVKKRKIITCPETAMVESRILQVAEDCPFLTHAHAAFQTKEHLIHVMEYASGGSLGNLIYSYGFLSINITRFFSAEMVCGIEFLHRRGIVHRDLKPDNILLDRNGHLKIADFGLALENTYGNDERTGAVGSFGYIAPEMLKGASYNSSVDWWALGVIIYQMSTGVLPFTGMDYEYLIMEVMQMNYPQSLTQELRDLLQELWITDPALRLNIAEDIHEHDFFDAIDWEKVERQQTVPPFRPQPFGTSRMAFWLKNQEKPLISSEEVQTPLAPEHQALFQGFSFISPRWS